MTKIHSQHIFREYDIRGKYPEEIDEKFAFELGKAFGTKYPGMIVVGADVRLSSPSLKNELIKGLVSTGANVIDLGMVTSPITMFSVRHLQCDGGIIVTGSHIPKEFNGFKLYEKNAVPISYGTGLNELEKIIERDVFSQGKGKVEKKDLMDEYVKFLKEKIKMNQPINFKVVVDAGNGSASIYPAILREFGIEVYELFCEPDGNFPNHIPYPSKVETLRTLQQKVIETKSDLGFAYDGDGDRVAVVDENGKIIHVEIVFSVLIEGMLSENPKSKVIYTAVNSNAIEDLIRNNGGIPLVSRVGHTLISRKMLEEDAAIAGELSGHYCFKDAHAADDAMFATLKIIEYLIESNKKFSDYEREFPKYFSSISESNRFDTKESEKFPFIQKIKEEFEAEGYKIDTLEGVKIFFEDGWILVRPSNTEAIIMVCYESKTKEGFEKLKAVADDIIKRIPR